MPSRIKMELLGQAVKPSLHYNHPSSFSSIGQGCSFGDQGADGLGDMLCTLDPASNIDRAIGSFDVIAV